MIIKLELNVYMYDNINTLVIVKRSQVYGAWCYLIYGYSDPYVLFFVECLGVVARVCDSLTQTFQVRIPSDWLLHHLNKKHK